MADFSSKKSNFISGTVQTAQQIIDAYYRLKQLSDSNTDQGFLGGVLDLTDGDFVGDNNHLTRALFLDGLTKGFLPVITTIEATVGGNANDARENIRKLLRT